MGCVFLNYLPTCMSILLLGIDVFLIPIRPERRKRKKNGKVHTRYHSNLIGCAQGDMYFYFLTIHFQNRWGFRFFPSPDVQLRWRNKQGDHACFLGNVHIRDSTTMSPCS